MKTVSTISEAGNMTQDAQMKYILATLNKRAKEILELPETKKYILSKGFTKEEAKQWLHDQALITLLYSPEQRKEMIEKREIKA